MTLVSQLRQKALKGLRGCAETPVLEFVFLLSCVCLFFM